MKSCWLFHWFLGPFCRKPIPFQVENPQGLMGSQRPAHCQMQQLPLPVRSGKGGFTSSCFCCCSLCCLICSVVRLVGWFGFIWFGFLKFSFACLVCLVGLLLLLLKKDKKHNFIIFPVPLLFVAVLLLFFYGYVLPLFMFFVPRFLLVLLFLQHFYFSVGCVNELTRARERRF